MFNNSLLCFTPLSDFMKSTIFFKYNDTIVIFCVFLFVTTVCTV
jgi:hypothetical protein